MAGRKPKFSTFDIKNYMSLYSRKYPSRQITISKLVDYINNETDCVTKITYKNINNNADIKREIEYFNTQLKKTLVTNDDGHVSLNFNIEDALHKCKTQSGARIFLAQIQSVIDEQNYKIESLIIDRKRLLELEQILKERQELDAKSIQYRKQNIELRKQNKELISLNSIYRKFICENLTDRSFAQFLVDSGFLQLHEGQEIPDKLMNLKKCMTIYDSLDKQIYDTDNSDIKREQSNIVSTQEFVHKWKKLREENR